MAPHEEFLELCAAATAGELTADEQARLEAHLAACPECREAKRECEVASLHTASALASEFVPEESQIDSSWSVEEAEKAFLKRLDSEKESSKADGERRESAKRGQRFTYRPSQVQW